MKSLLASLSLLALIPLTVPGQTADDFFHGGAQHYLSNKVAEAIAFVEDGLKRHPEDIKLKKLEELLKRQNQQQQQQQQQQQEQQQDQNSEQNQDSKDQQQENQKQDQQKPEPDEKKDPQQQNRSERQTDPKPGDEQQQQQAQAKPGQMTPEEARQLLESQKGDEQMLPVNPEKKAGMRARPVKDW